MQLVKYIAYITIAIHSEAKKQLVVICLDGLSCVLHFCKNWPIPASFVYVHLVLITIQNV